MPSPGDRLIIDTNLLVSFLITKDYTKLDKIFAEENVILLYSQQLIDEFIEVTQRPKLKKYFAGSDLQDFLLGIARRAHFIEVSSVVNISRDAKDNFLLALAKDGKATHLLTGDKDLLVLKKIGKTKIITLREYLDTSKL